MLPCKIQTGQFGVRVIIVWLQLDSFQEESLGLFETMIVIFRVSQRRPEIFQNTEIPGRVGQCFLILIKRFILMSSVFVSVRPFKKSQAGCSYSPGILSSPGNIIAQFLRKILAMHGQNIFCLSAFVNELPVMLLFLL